MATASGQARTPLTHDDMSAYPFPRLSSYHRHLPHTPKQEQKSESSSNSSYLEMPLARHEKSKHRIRWLFVIVLSIIVFLYIVYPSSSASRHTDKISFSHDIIDDYLAHFEGHQECGIMSPELYTPPKLLDHNVRGHTHYCYNRQRLLEAMSHGGRHGFDRPFSPDGCQYRWYTTTEICMILERFDDVVFIGDDMLKTIYAAFNMLLRENIGLGGLQQWQLGDMERDKCRCDNQITKPECINHIVSTNIDVRGFDKDDEHRSPYHCDKTNHRLISISGSPDTDINHQAFAHSILSKDPESYKPIPVILSLGLSTSLSWPLATAAMDEWVGIADNSGRNTPFLWVGPNAAGHLKPPGQILTQGNNALWHYTLEMEKEARSREFDALGMYNMTMQANSWDGSGYGLRVALVQAMMVINWLSRVEST